jgi:hypothetical protein
MWQETYEAVEHALDVSTWQWLAIVVRHRLDERCQPNGRIDRKPLAHERV